MRSLPLVGLALLAAPLHGQSTLTSSEVLDADTAIVQDAAFGGAVATSGEWLVVGADQTAVGFEGEVHLFQRIGGAVFQAEDSENGAAQGDAFGAGVDIDASGADPVVIVGAPENAAQVTGGGRAYVYDFTGGALQLYTTLAPSAPQQNSAFGTAVATDGDVFAVGRPDFAVGEVLMWDRSSGSLQPLSSVTAFDGTTGDGFGSALALDQSVLAVGAPLHDGAALDGGAVYLAEQSVPGSSFALLQPLLTAAKVTASDAAAGDRFGEAVALAGDVLVAGAPGKGPGAAYVLRRAGGGAFAEEAIVTVPGLPSNAGFGSSVAVTDGRIVVGAIRASTVDGATGAGFVFEETAPSSGVWELEWKLEGPGVGANANLGAACALIDEIAIVGAPRAEATSPVDGQVKQDAGTAHVFDVSLGFCSLDLLGKPTGGRADRFGAALAQESDTAIVASPLDDDSASDAGSVAVLRRNGFAWDFEQILTAPSPTVQGLFGTAVALDANSLVIGAPSAPSNPFAIGRVSAWERAFTTDPFVLAGEFTAAAPEQRDRFGAALATASTDLLVGAPGTDDLAGAVHAFDRALPGDPWEGLQTLSGFDPSSALAEFGSAVDLGGDDLLVGSPGSDVGASDGGSVTFLERRSVAALAATLVSNTDPVLVGLLDPDDEFAGIEVEPIGDIDGNGVVDLAIGAHKDDDAAANAGAVYLVRMASDLTVEGVTKITVPDALMPLEASDNFGAGLAAGQFDLDPFPELAVGAYRDDGVHPNAGAVWILDFDAAWNLVGSWRIDDTVPGLGLNSQDYFGRSVANLGDVDGNGVDDLAVGTMFDDDAGPQSGSVRTLLLGASQNVLSVGVFDTLTFGLGPSDGDQLGVSMERIPDVDGDSVPDLAVGATSYGSGSEGAVYLLRVHAPNASLSLISRIAPGESGFDGEVQSGDVFGASIASLGDVDGDGAADLLVGASQDDDSGVVGDADKGALWVLRLDSSGNVVESGKISASQGSLGEFEGDFLGLSLGALGDIDGDGNLEFAVGAKRTSEDHGAFWILELGEGWGTTAQAVVPAASAAGDRFGTAVAVDGDTALVGVPGDDDLGPEAGAVVVFERSGGDFTEVGILRASEGAAGDGFGSSILLDGDRAFIGAPGGFAGPPTVGATYVFERIAPGLPFVQTLRIEAADDGEAGDRFGASLAVSGSTVLVGAPDWDAATVDEGTVYAYSLSSASCPSLIATADYVSINVGGDQELFLKPGPEYGASLHFYLVLASFAESPPTPVAPGVTLPLALDAVLLASLSGANLPPFLNTFGALDSSGEAQAQIALPDTLPVSLIGQELFAAYILLDPLQAFAPVFASEAVGLELVP